LTRRSEVSVCAIRVILHCKLHRLRFAIHQLVRRARGAQAVFEQFPQERVDAIVRDFAKYVYDNAELVAGMAHKETGLGVYDDKVLKAPRALRVQSFKPRLFQPVCQQSDLHWIVTPDPERQGLCRARWNLKSR
jgi:acyl-CoA reductase-like NAD-dependent aldehyde dehydrogenase